MRFLADENVEAPVVASLRAKGFDVVLASERLSGSPDPWVLSLATSDQRVLITNDKDFAELTFLRGHAAIGIVLLRLGTLPTLEKAERLLEVVQQLGAGLVGHLTVVGSEATRRRPFPDRL
ncbi:MAG TPA: DUF5615 family PIN-like protein [Thermoanaerobaculia bacterium]|nr:DUF5615 family PIN-like protein [Thermoanaerobaculia bacterium]